MLGRLVLPAALLPLLAPLAAHAQAIPTPDVSVVSVAAAVGPSVYACRAVVQSATDGVEGATLTILLPTDVRVQAVSSRDCAASRLLNGANSSVLCSLGQLGAGEVRAISLRASAPPATTASRSCAAFVTSETPDGDRTNNYGLSIEP